MLDLKLTESRIKESEYEREKVIDLKIKEYEYKRKESMSMREKVNKRCLCEE